MSSTCEISPHEDFNRWQLNRSAQPTASRPPAYERSRVVFTKHGREDDTRPCPCRQRDVSSGRQRCRMSTPPQRVSLAA
jgi:hypothetical protein